MAGLAISGFLVLAAFAGFGAGRQRLPGAVSQGALRATPPSTSAAHDPGAERAGGVEQVQVEPAWPSRSHWRSRRTWAVIPEKKGTQDVSRYVTPSDQ